MIVVTTPTGRIGRSVVETLLATDTRLRLIVRQAASLPASVRERTEVIEGSHGDADVVDRAFDGADAIFWVAPPDVHRTLEGAYLDFTRPAAAAIRRYAVPRIVSVTALGRGTPWQERAGLVTASIHMDDLLMETGAAFRGLAMPSSMENVSHQAGAIRAKQTFFGAADPDKRSPTTATRDMADVAARLLADAGWTGQRELPLLGPEDLSANEMAAIMSEELGRDIRYEQMSLDAFKQQLLGREVSESFAQGYVDMVRAKNEGMDNVAERTADSRTPTSFRQWVRESLEPAVRG